MSAISPKKGSIGVIIRLFKGDCTKAIRLIQPDFAWQKLFHDHIIRTPGELQAIRRYIKQNPKNW